MIDIETLKQYPLSFSLLEKWVEQKYITSLALLLDKVTNEEYLEFFDGNNVNIQISIKCSLNNGRWYLPYIWSYSDGCDMEDHLPDSKTRKEATETAIKKAFELLEQKLKVN